MDLIAFSKLMQKRAKNLPSEVNKVKKEISTEALKSLAENTPVDKGTAVSNWQVGLNQNDMGARAAFAPGTHGSTASENVRATIAAGSAVIAQARIGQVIHIVNPLPYIKRLNDGWSAQRPAGFVERALLKANSIIKRAKVIKD